MNIRNFKSVSTRQGGFTLIELVIVIVILGILAAVAVPRFIDLSDEAREAAVEGIAGSLASGIAINYAGCSANSHDDTDPDCVAVANCTDAESTIEGALGGYTITAAAITGNGTSVSCTVTDDADGTYTATFQGIGAGQ